MHPGAGPRLPLALGAAAIVALVAFVPYALAAFGLRGYGWAEWLVFLLVLGTAAAAAPERHRPALLAAGLGLMATLSLLTAQLAPVAATALFLASCVGVGRGLRSLAGVAAGREDPGGDLAVGLLAHVAAFGVLVHFPVNGRELYLLLLLPGAWAARHALAAGARRLADGIAAPLSRPELLAWALLATVLLYPVLVARLPSVSYDDQAYHLLLFFELRDHGRALFDVDAQIWSVAPFAADLVHAIPSVVAGVDSRGAVNLALLLATCANLFRVSRRIAGSRASAALNVALYASTPLVFMLQTTLQHETFLAYLASVACRLLAADRARSGADEWLQALAVAALLAATKTTGAVLGLLLLAAMALVHRPRAGLGAIRWRGLAVAAGWVALCSVAALGAYAYAWRVTGNPVFPLFNAVFGSPLIDAVNFSNPRFAKDPSPASFVRMFFRTGEYQESRDGVAGFQHLVLLPLLALALAGRGRARFAVATLVAVALVYGAVVFSSQQYARYLVPAAPLLAGAFAAIPAAAALPGAPRWAAAGVAALWVGLTVLNLHYAKGAIWYLPKSLLLQTAPGADAAFLDRHVPERRLAAVVNDTAGAGARVLYDPARPYAAGLAGRPLMVEFYNPRLLARAVRARSGDDVAAILRDFGATHVMFETTGEAGGADYPHPWRRALAEFLAQSGDPLARLSNVTLYRLREPGPPPAPLLDLGGLRGAGAPAASDGALRLSPQAGTEARTKVRVGPGGVLVVKLRADCGQNAGMFVHLDWGPLGPPHGRRVACDPASPAAVVDVASVPAGASSVEVVLGWTGGGEVAVRGFELLQRP